MALPPRPFSTSARVHPSYLPHAQPTARKPTGRWAVGLVGLAVVGYGTRVLIDKSQEQRALREVKEREDAERRRRNDMLLDVYGTGESLEELEKAVRFYEEKNK